MENLFVKKSLPLDFPELSGWYDTDKGNLYWFRSEKTWSCREDRISEEDPRFWYEQLEISELKPESKKLQKWGISTWERDEANMEPDSTGCYYEVEEADNLILQLKLERLRKVEVLEGKLNAISDHITKNSHCVHLNFILEQTNLTE